MIKPKTFRKLPECETCLFYTGDLMLPCPIHPRGVATPSCLDYRDSPMVALQWQTFLGDGPINEATDLPTNLPTDLPQIFPPD